MNLYTHAVRKMAQNESIERHFKKISERLETIIVMLDDLLAAGYTLLVMALVVRFGVTL